ncbi:MAG TPA: hypothetical protein VFR06_07510 [Gallionellaceae bacterium]|nr:hypothetical protein [Gallionellaceae bacterium]
MKFVNISALVVWFICGAALAADSGVAPIPLHLGEVHLQLETSPPGYDVVPRPPALSKADAAVKYAKLANETWYNEEVTCVRKSPDGRMVVVGGYLRRTFLLGHRPRRLFGSRVHVLDSDTHKEVIALETAPVAERTREEKGGSKILDCMFVANSRYLAAVTNSKLFLWDAEHGRVLGEVYFDRALDVARLEFGRSGGGYFLGVAGKGKKLVYRLQTE